MGVRGFEPRTSALSELRSNQLSYTPLSRFQVDILSIVKRTVQSLFDRKCWLVRNTPLPGHNSPGQEAVLCRSTRSYSSAKAPFGLQRRCRELQRNEACLAFPRNWIWSPCRKIGKLCTEFRRDRVVTWKVGPNCSGKFLGGRSRVESIVWKPGRVAHCRDPGGCVYCVFLAPRTDFGGGD